MPQARRIGSETSQFGSRRGMPYGRYGDTAESRRTGIPFVPLRGCLDSPTREDRAGVLGRVVLQLRSRDARGVGDPDRTRTGEGSSGTSVFRARDSLFSIIRKLTVIGKIFAELGIGSWRVEMRLLQSGPLGGSGRTQKDAGGWVSPRGNLRLGWTRVAPCGAGIRPGLTAKPSCQRPSDPCAGSEGTRCGATPHSSS